MISPLSARRKEYLLSAIDPAVMDTDPLVQFSAWFDDAVRAEIEEPNAMVLSTADSAGNVSGRVVLLKGVEKGGFVFFTNYESRKGLQLSANPNAALTFLWFAIERQVRVEGKVTKLSRKESIDYFNSRPADSRVSACASPQSCVIPDREFLVSMREGLLLDLNGQAPQCPSNWGGYLLLPTLVEFWQGREHRLHDRIQYKRTGKLWKVARLAP
ncbi:MAG: pyridoxamine 5'-phosphate oxidase [Bacteroidales bacterium]